MTNPTRLQTAATTPRPPAGKRPAYADDPTWLEVLANLTGPMPTTLRVAAKRLQISPQALHQRLHRAGYRLESGPEGVEKIWKKIPNSPP